ncbi:HAMP domain-containing protein [Kitasatospora mediocidica]|uniref:HAMP domain-containing protein n=1 Tax=Kitasatospora mediocidica TaxID=58352 RepID=UPI000562352D|nr:HAMP domain-containing protein [Kitasatospora mediocidica]
MRARIALLVALASLVSTALFAVPLAWYVRHAYLQEAGASALGRAQSLAAVAAGLPGTGQELADELSRQLVPSLGDVVFLPDGTLLGRRLAGASAVRNEATGQVEPGRTPLGPAGRDQAYLIPVATPGGERVVVAAVIENHTQWDTIRRIWLAIGGALVLLPLTSCVLAHRFGRSLVAPVDRLASAATQMADGDLSARVEPGGGPELRRLGESFNVMASQIATRVAAEREAAADISHRLRTPVTALMLQAESLNDPEESARLLESTRRLQSEVSQVIERARRPAVDERGATCDLAAVAREQVDFWKPLAQDQDRRCAFAVNGKQHRVDAPADEVAAAVDALLANVFTHTPDGSDLSVKVDERRNGPVTLAVTDSGPGIRPEYLRRGASGSGSSGLGLDIVARLAESTGGFLRIDRPVGGGARVTVAFGRPGRA